VKRFLIHHRFRLLLAAALTVVGAAMLIWSVQEYDRVQAREMERLSLQSKVVEDNLTRQLTAISLSLTAIRSDLPGWLSENKGYQEALHTLERLGAAIPAVRTFLVTDANGIVTLSNRLGLLGFDAFARDYVQAPLKALNLRLLYVSPPFKSSVDNSYLISLTQVLLDGQGRFDGVVSAAVDPPDIDILLNSVRYADDMKVLLAHGDGTVFLSQPQSSGALGGDLSTLTPFGYSRSPEAGVAGQDARVLSSTRGEQLSVMRSIAPSALGMDKPLRVVLMRQRSAVFAGWHRDVRHGALFFVFLSLIGVAGLQLLERRRVQNIVAAKRLKLATEASGVGIWEFDLLSKCYYWDEAMFKLFGLTPKGVSERNDEWQRLLSAQDLKRMRDATRLTINQGQTFDMIFQVTRPDGQVRAMRNRAALYADDLGVPRRLIGATEDVTERRQHEAEQRVAAVAFESADSMLVADADSKILRVNTAFSLLFGYSAQEVIGKNPRLLQSGRHQAADYHDMWMQLRRDHRWRGEIWNQRKTGEKIACSLSITAVCDEEGQVTHYVATHTDITLRRAAEEEVKRLAFYDPLTGLPNRRLLSDRLQQAISQAHRARGQVAMLFVDLDKFKPVNDRYGHAAGDVLLGLVAQRLLACVRESDTVARLGGDEFVLLLPDIRETQDAVLVAGKIHAQLRLPFALPGAVAVCLSSSTGIAIYPVHGNNEAELSRSADVAMYAAKADGRDCFLVYAPEMEGHTGKPVERAAVSTQPLNQRSLPT